MNIIRNFFSTVLGSLLTLVLGFLIIIFSVTLVIFDSKFILSTIEKNNTYKILATEIIPEALVYAITQKFQEKPNQQIASKITENLNKSTFEPLGSDLKKAFEDSYLFVLSEKDQFEVRIELNKYVPSLEKGLTETITGLQTSGELQGLNTQELTSDLQTAKSASLLFTQDRIEIAGVNDLAASSQSQDKSFLRQARELLKKLTQTQGLLIVAAAVLGVLLFLSRVPHWLSGIKWLSTTAISAAFFPLVLSFILILVKPVNLISEFLKEQDTVANFKPAVDLLSINLQVILEKIFFTLLIIAGALMVAGIFLNVAVFFLSKKFSQVKHS